MLRIEIEGDPIPLARPRYSVRRVYQPKRNVEYRHRVQAAARLAMAGAEPMSGELCAVVKLYRKYKPTARNFGDADNHLKAIMDALTGICYKDDCQICRCTVEKFTDKENPRAVIEVGAMED